jgi:AAA domain/Bifunctional DNA primase/polymerase, N-terminal
MPPSSRAEMAAALAAEFGLPIILLQPGEKRPKHKGAFEAQALTDPAAIRKALRGSDNYGIAFGPRARCFALDVDEGGAQTIEALTQRLGPLPPTWRIRTQSGGYQDLFDWPPDTDQPVRNRGRFAPGLDVRGQGGQSVGPLSEFLDRSTGELRPWAWAPGRSPWDLPRQPMPEPWLEAIRAYKAPRYLGPPPAKPLQPQPQNRLQAYANSIFDAKLAALASAPDGLQEASLGAASLKAGSLIARGWLSQAYAHDAIVATMLGLPNYDAHDPWTPDLVTLKTRRGIERGQSSPEPDPAWAAELEARERPRPSKLKALNGGKPHPPQAETEVEDAAIPPPKMLKSRWIDEADLPPRRWLYGKHYIRGYVSCTIASGGTGKSMLAIAEACAMASGKPLLGIGPTEPLRVGYWNGEDPMEEIDLRIFAFAKRHGLRRRDIENRLFWGSGRDPASRLTLAAASGRGVVEVDQAVLQQVLENILADDLDVLIVDPFVSSHRAPENDNGAMDLVAKTWAWIAEQTDIAVEFIHHSRKTAPGQDIGVDDARGGSALIDAARSVRQLNRMNDEAGKEFGIQKDEWFRYVRIDHGKANHAPPESATWMHIVSQHLDTGPDDSFGDSVGVVTRWEPQLTFDGIGPDAVLRVQQAIAASSSQSRKDPKSPNWAGKLVAEVLKLDIGDKTQKARINRMLRVWIEKGLLEVDKIKDEQRRPRDTYVVGEWIDPVTRTYV